MLVDFEHERLGGDEPESAFVSLCLPTPPDLKSTLDAILEWRRGQPTKARFVQPASSGRRSVLERLPDAAKAALDVLRSPPG